VASTCPSCAKAVEQDAWICPNCDHILDPSVLGVDGQAEAKILDDNIAFLPGEEFDLVEGLGGRQDGSTGRFAFYAPRSSSRRILSLDAVPIRMETTEPKAALTPYEDCLLDLIDGEKTVQQIVELSRLSRKDVSLSLLSLFDRKLISPKPGYEADPTDGAPPPDERETGDVAPMQPPSEPAGPAELSEDIDMNDEGSTDAVEPPTGEEPPPDEEPPSDERESVATVPSDLDDSDAPPGERAAAPPAVVPSSRSGEFGHDPRILTEHPKAILLVEASLRDLTAGNRVSARMNMKLALSFDPENRKLQAALNQLSRSGPSGPSAPPATTPARQLSDRAMDAERAGRVDEAIEMLEKGIEQERDPVLLNHLGVLLATRKKEFQRGRLLIEEAIQISPDHNTYRHNLERVGQLSRARAASTASSRPAPPPRRSSILGLFGRKDKS
jgi:hypothetical protein